MSCSKSHPYKIVALLIWLMNSSVFAGMSCYKQWGPATVSEEGCTINMVSTSDPSSLLLRGLNWEAQEKTLAIKMMGKNTSLLRGVMFRFFQKGELQATYTLPLFGDQEYNLIQDGLEVFMTIPLSELDWKIERPSKISFDGASIYLATKNVEDKSKVLELNFFDFVMKDRAKSGAISITFDDGYISNFKAAELMKPFGLKGTAYLIPSAIGRKGYLSLNELKLMKEWGWGMSSHLETPVTEIKDLPKVLSETLKDVTSWGNNGQSSHFALPLGKYNKEVLPVLKEKFTSVRLAGGNTETLPLYDPFRIKAINVTNQMTPKQVFEKCKRALENREWAVLMFHYLDQPEKGLLNYSSKNYKILMELLAPLKDMVKPVHKVLN